MKWISSLRDIATRWRDSRDEYRQLDSLLTLANPDANLAEQVLWMAELGHWLRAKSNTTDTALTTSGNARSEHVRLRYFLQVLNNNPDFADRVARVVGTVMTRSDALALFVDTGLASRNGLLRELWTRIKLRLLPHAPNDGSLATLFSLLFRADDYAWVSTIDAELATQLGALVARHASTRNALFAAIGNAIVHLASQVSAGVTETGVRQRADLSDVAFRSLLKLPVFASELIEADDEAVRVQALNRLRAAIDLARDTTNGVYDHLDRFGVSVTVVFDVEELLRRIARLDQLLAVWATGGAANESVRLVAALVEANSNRASLLGLLNENYALLGKKVVERSAETGEHYIARSRGEYFTMLKRASGGGAITALTVYGKFFVTSLGLSRFFEGLFLFFDYAASFLAIHFAHFTLATKQPAMTAPALAAKLDHVADEKGKQDFVDETIALVRSQVAAVIGNLAMVTPVALAIQLIWIYTTGESTFDEAKAIKTIESFSVLGWTPIFAAFTGILLWLSSLSGGWADNWVALHRLGDGLRFQRRLKSVFGERGSEHIASFVERHAAGVTSNVVLALLLGFTPIVAAFFGLGLDVRHVTLSTGSIAAASVVIGASVFEMEAFWLAVGGVLAMGALNIGVSFYLALAMALSSSRVGIGERWLLRRRVIAEIARKPYRLLLPPKATA
jgi:site-specific recombinase